MALLNNIKKAVSALVFTLAAFLLHAQSGRQILVTLDADSMQFKDIVKELENKLPLHFYYDPNALDTARFTLHARDKELPTALSDLFGSRDMTPWHFAIDSLNEVFISRYV